MKPNKISILALTLSFFMVTAAFSATAWVSSLNTINVKNTLIGNTATVIKVQQYDPKTQQYSDIFSNAAAFDITADPFDFFQFSYVTKENGTSTTKYTYISNMKQQFMYKVTLYSAIDPSLLYYTPAMFFNSNYTTTAQSGGETVDFLKDTKFMKVMYSSNPKAEVFPSENFIQATEETTLTNSTVQTTEITDETILSALGLSQLESVYTSTIYIKLLPNDEAVAAAMDGTTVLNTGYTISNIVHLNFGLRTIPYKAN